MSGVVAREKARQAHWDALGLPDPVFVLSSEARTRLYLPDFTSPLRALLDPYFDAHPDERPRGW